MYRRFLLFSVFCLLTGSTFADEPKTFEGKKYQFFPEVLSWKEAKAKCESLGGRLAIVTSQDMNDFLTKMVLDAGKKEAWLGSTDEETEGVWVNVDGTPMTFKNWNPGQPNNKPPGEHYVVMIANQKGKWADQPNVSHQHQPGFVCEYVKIETIAETRKLAEDGDAAAMYRLALALSKGADVKRDPMEAKAWWSKAADKGHHESMTEMGIIYAIGSLVAKDEAKAREFWMKAAEKDPRAFYNLGYMASNHREYKEAAEWFHKGAAKNHPASMSQLGYMYSKGLGVPLDDSISFSWTKKAAELGDPLGIANLGRRYAVGQGVAQNYREAAKWMQMGVDRSIDQSLNDLGKLYRDGHGVPRDYKKSVELFRKSIELGFPEAHFSLGEMYEFGAGVPKSMVEATKWYTKAAGLGYADAKKKLAEMQKGR